MKNKTLAAALEERRTWFKDRSDPTRCRGRVTMYVGQLFGPDSAQCSRAPVKGEKFCWQHLRTLKKRTASHK